MRTHARLLNGRKSLVIALITLLCASFSFSTPSLAAEGDGADEGGVHFDGVDEGGILFDNVAPHRPGARTGEDPGYQYFYKRGGKPIGYDHCKTQKVQINPVNATGTMVKIAKQAIKKVKKLTGLDLKYAGTTYKNFNSYRSPKKIGQEPIRISFENGFNIPVLDGDNESNVLGIGGSVTADAYGNYVRPGKARQLAGGRLVIDLNDFKPTIKRAATQRALRLVLLHELGHVVGLAHTSKPSQLMYYQLNDQNGFGNGDRRGLKKIGNTPCASKILKRAKKKCAKKYPRSKKRQAACIRKKI